MSKDNNINLCITCKSLDNPIIIWQRIGNTPQSKFDVVTIYKSTEAKGWAFKV